MGDEQVWFPCGHGFVGDFFSPTDDCPICGPEEGATPLQLAQRQHTALAERYTETGEGEMALIDAGKELVAQARAAAFEEAAKEVCALCRRGNAPIMNTAGNYYHEQHMTPRTFDVWPCDANAIRRRGTPAPGEGHSR